MSGAEEDRKRAARAEQVALFRYQLIREAADPSLSTRQRGRLVRELAGRAHPGPFGEPVRVSRETIDRWIRAWRAGRVRRAGPAGPPGHPPHRRGRAGTGRRAETGEPRPHRRAGDADPAGQLRLWTGDALHGPHIAGRKAYLFAFLDDHSRAVMAARWGYFEDSVRLAAALRPALAGRGVPGSIYVDYAGPRIMPTRGRKGCSAG